MRIEFKLVLEARGPNNILKLFWPLLDHYLTIRLDQIWVLALMKMLITQMTFTFDNGIQLLLKPNIKAALKTRN